jgi:hypothetical protein
MAYTTINKSSEHFNTKLYTGTGSSQSVTGVGFQPDFTWIKQRSGTEQNVLFDAVRGVQKYIASNTTAAEATTATTLTAFNADGFTEGGHGMTGANGSTYASWNWKAGGGQGSSNTDGSINTTYTSVNTTAGFSISKYSGTGSNATIGHGLGVAPKMVIVKRLTGGADWVVGHDSMGWTKYIYLSANSAQVTSASAAWNDTAPTNSVFTVATNTQVNASGSDYVAYCFAEKTGYSKFGSYTGNNNADGAFVYTGFKPEFVIVKPANYADNWHMIDNKRDTFNPMDTHMFPNLNNGDSTASSYEFDMLSNGFKPRSNNSAFNGSYNYIYMAFGQSLVGSNNVPCTAR